MTCETSDAAEKVFWFLRATGSRGILHDEGRFGMDRSFGRQEETTAGGWGEICCDLVLVSVPGGEGRQGCPTVIELIWRNG